MTKQEQIAIQLTKPIEVNDWVNIKIAHIVKETTGKGKTLTDYGKVISIKNDPKNGLLYKIEHTNRSIPYELSIYDSYYHADWITPSTRSCGANNFKKDVPDIRFLAQDISSLLSKCGYHGKSLKPEYHVMTGNAINDKLYIGCTHGGVNFDPYITDADGKRVFYQRGLVWTLEQKQLLIDSIYNGIEIGKFIFRYKSWEDITKQMTETKHGFNFDCVDGKQRLNCLIEFVQDNFQDSYGFYFSDLSAEAQNKFMRYGKLAIGELGENSTDKDVINTFLTLNFTGTPMSADHINYVKSINI